MQTSQLPFSRPGRCVVENDSFFLLSWLLVFGGSELSLGDRAADKALKHVRDGRAVFPALAISIIGGVDHTGSSMNRQTVAAEMNNGTAI